MAVTTGTPGHRKRTRGGDGGFRRTIDDVQRDVEAATLHCQGQSYSLIARTLGYASAGKACEGVQRAQWEMSHGESLRQARDTRLHELDEIRAELWATVKNPPPVVSRTGQIVRDEQGKPVPDETVKVKAAGALIQAIERTARLQGLDAPRQTHATVEATIAAIPQADLRAYIHKRATDLGVTSPADRRALLEAALAELDAEERRAAAIPAIAEPA
jgi:hypothetical protein